MELLCVFQAAFKRYSFLQKSSIIDPSVGSKYVLEYVM